MGRKSKIIVFGLCVLILIFIFKSFDTTYKNVSVKTVEVGTATQTPVEMDTLPENYKCYNLSRLNKSTLTFCKRKTSFTIIPGKPYVQGYYIRGKDIIYVSKDLDKSGVLHELFHAVDIGNSGQDSESRAYEFQQLYWQLVDLKLL